MTIDTLCLSGGGFGGLTYLGILKNLLDEKFFNFKNIKKIVGVSIGSIVGFFLSLNYQINDLIKFFYRFDIKKLEPDIDCENLFNLFGLLKGDKIITMIKTFLYEKTKKYDITFKALYKFSNINFIIIATNYTKMKEAEFSFKKTPNFSVLKAIRMSISIPIIFTPVRYKNNIYVDGGILNNFPLNYCTPENTLGLYSCSIKENKAKNLIQFVSGIKSILYKKITNQYILDKYPYLIQTGQIKETNITNFNYNLKIKKKIINKGINVSRPFCFKNRQKIIKVLLDDMISIISCETS